MKTFAQILMGLAAALFIISAASTITLNAGFIYSADIEKYELEKQTGMSREEIEANYKAMVDYNNLTGPDKLVFPTLPMSEGGRIHFEDVKKVFCLVEITAIVTGILTLVFIIISAVKKLLTYRLAAGIITIALPAAVGIYAAFAWDSLFVTFHKLVFNNDYWMFNPETDPVILILPDGYFLHCLILIVVLALAGAAAFFIWYFLGRRKLQKA